MRRAVFLACVLFLAGAVGLGICNQMRPMLAFDRMIPIAYLLIEFESQNNRFPESFDNFSRWAALGGKSIKSLNRMQVNWGVGVDAFLTNKNPLIISIDAICLGDR